MITVLLDLNIHHWLMHMGMSVDAANFLGVLVAIILITIAAVCIGRPVVELGSKLITRLTRKSKAEWDDVIFAPSVTRRVLALATPILIYVCLPIAFIGLDIDAISEADRQSLSSIHAFLQHLCLVIIVLMISHALAGMLNGIDNIYQKRDVYQMHPIKGIIQTVQLLIYLVAVIIAISILVQESPIALLTGLGAAAAVLMLVFQDTILGFVSGFQLSLNKMLRVGDWITMNKYGVDGTVIEIGLNAVKVQNFDNTILTLPPTTLMRESFQNWRGMSESGGRRVKRSVYLDMQSVKFCTSEMLERYKRVHLLSAYLDGKEQEVKTYNQSHSIDETVLVNGRHQTNLGVLRAYLSNYLMKHPLVNHTMTCMVRQLQPTELGLPLELYFFTSTTVWEDYESIMADVFDHVIAVVPYFDLQVFQNPSGADMRSFNHNFQS
ncbi:MAG: mechanosensitive ion channel family protein [Prevotellaceae bacterium]|jgi:miniconductance mechanosensitive channel|nr:mechanosensitive ion channel family protein [Prevotellaceae bacterium]